MTKPTARDKEILFRFALAQRFTSPAKPIKPRIEPDEIERLISAGLLERGGANWRPTAAGTVLVAAEVASFTSPGWRVPLTTWARICDAVHLSPDIGDPEEVASRVEALAKKGKGRS